ncbi:MAG: PilZ domain-containing protein [Nitrospirota bacterium]
MHSGSDTLIISVKHFLDGKEKTVSFAGDCHRITTMKKIIITDTLKDFVRQHVSLLAGYDNTVFYVKSGHEALDIHRKENVDLIIAALDFSDLPCEQFCATIRGDDMLKKVSILIVCPDSLADIERCLTCGASDYITEPLAPATFLWKVLQLLNISERTSYRVVVKVSLSGDVHDPPFFCTSQNISASGILLETDRVLKEGDRISCSFFLPNSIRIHADGVVVRVTDKEPGLKDYGVRFVDLPSSVSLQIVSFVENWPRRKTR